jgi:hypothetical protein
MFQKLLEKIATALDGASIPYMIIGGQAVLLYGEPRLTKDIDITLGVGVESLASVKEVVALLGFAIAVKDPEDFVKRTMVLPARDEASGIRIDLVFSFSPYERQAIERARAVPFGDAIVRFASPEDVVIQKIVAGRPRDLEDVRTMLFKNPSCDRTYVERWLGEFDASLDGGFLTTFRTIASEVR